MTSWSLARRDLLRRLGVGAACLPLLGATRARGAPARRRLIVIQTGQGYRQQYWRPPVGPLDTLPPSSAPLEPVKRELNFLPDLSPSVRASGSGGYGVLFYGPGASGGALYKEPAGKTLDQVVGSALASSGQRVSLNLGVQLDRPPRATEAPGGNYCFWAGAGMPVKPIGDPVAVYKEIISAGPADPAAARRLLYRRKSILDYVGGNLTVFGKRLGSEDRAAIEGHSQALRELEGQLQTLSSRPQCEVGPPLEPFDLGAGGAYPKILAAHLGLMVIALKCGITSVATLQTSDASGLNIEVGAFIPGIPPRGAGYGGSLREVSQNPVYMGNDWKRIVDTWFMSQFAGLLGQLKAVAEDGLTMLDSTVVLIGNHMQDGANEDASKLPWMLAGNCNRYFDTGRCLASAGRPTATVMAAICESLGVAGHPYGAAMPELKKI